MNAVHEHYKTLGKIQLLSDLTDWLNAEIKSFMDKPATEYNGGKLNGLTETIYELQRQLVAISPKCKYCQDFPCRCEAIDAQRDYGRPESWNGNDY